MKSPIGLVNTQKTGMKRLICSRVISTKNTGQKRSQENDKLPNMTASQKEVSITRIIRHPREVVFKAWTDPAALQHWFAPRNCTISFSTIDIRTGGKFH